MLLTCGIVFHNDLQRLDGPGGVADTGELLLEPPAGPASAARAERLEHHGGGQLGRGEREQVGQARPGRP